jgi:hypothetical protein
MGTRRVPLSRATIAALLALLVPASAMADRHTADVGGGGVRARRSSLWGIGLTGDWIPRGGDWLCHDPSSDKHVCTLGLAGEFSWAKGDHDGGTLSQSVFQLGPRFTYNTLANWHAQPFLVALPGFTVERNEQDRTSFSIALGGGADVPLPICKKLVNKKEEPVWVTRVQVTWNWINNHRSDNSYVQVGISLVYRFEKD